MNSEGTHPYIYMYPFFSQPCFHPDLANPIVESLLHNAFLLYYLLSQIPFFFFFFRILFIALVVGLTAPIAANSLQEQPELLERFLSRGVVYLPSPCQERCQFPGHFPPTTDSLVWLCTEMSWPSSHWLLTLFPFDPFSEETFHALGMFLAESNILAF